MFYFTDVQKKIAKSLYFSPKTVEELAQDLNLSAPVVTKALAGLIKMELVEKKDYPTRYYLTDSIRSAVKAKPQEEYELKGIQIHAIVEATSFSEDVLKPQLQKLLDSLKSNKKYIIQTSTISDVVKDGDRYTSYLDITFSARDFTALVTFIYFFGPSVIEVLAPERIEIPLTDFQQGLLTMADIVHAYVEKLSDLSARQELKQFDQRLFGIKQGLRL